MVEKSIENIVAENHEETISLDETDLNIPIDEEWFSKKVKILSFQRSFNESVFELSTGHQCDDIENKQATDFPNFMRSERRAKVEPSIRIDAR